MIPLQVHITAGPQAGTRLQLTQTPVSFGRSPENTLVLDLTTVSRNHGELRFEEGQWWLHNLSQNGTKIGRKRVTKKPRAIAEGDAISIGDEEVFRAYYAQEATPAADPNALGDTDGEAHAAQPDIAPPGTGLGGRSKLWLILGAWFVFCIGLFILFATTCDKPDDGDTPRSTVQRYKTSDEVHKILRQDVERVTPDDRVYSVNVDDAREAYRTREDRYLYDAYYHYREAIRHLPASDELNAEDRQRYRQVIDELAALVYERLENAWRLFNFGNHEQALREVDELLQYFPARSGDNEVINSIMGLRERITRAMRQG